MYVYKYSEPGVYAVGFYKPDGQWVPESEHTTCAAAAGRVAWLNGGEVGAGFEERGTSQVNEPSRFDYNPNDYF